MIVEYNEWIHRVPYELVVNAQREMYENAH